MTTRKPDTISVVEWAAPQALIEIRAWGRTEGGRALITDESGDGLYLLDMHAHNAMGGQVLPARDFTLHDYDLSHTGGRQAARDYIRRKLKKLEAEYEARQPQPKVAALEGCAHFCR